MQAADRAGVVGQQRFKVLKALWRSENVRRGIESQVCSAGSQGPGCELRTRQCVGCGTSGRDSNRCDRSEHLDNAAVGENQISRFGRAAEAVIESNFSTHNNEQLGAQPRIGWEAGIRTPIPWSRGGPNVAGDFGSLRFSRTIARIVGPSPVGGGPFACKVSSFFQEFPIDSV